MNDIDIVQDELKTELEALKSSPMFQLSLASKELFHSNFIAWTIEKTDSGDKLIRCLFDFLKIEDTEIEYKFVQREKKHIDLTLHVLLKSGQYIQIVIENKVKSIPYKQQLEGYEKVEIEIPKVMKKSIIKKEPKKYYILLSLSEPTFDLDLDQSHWKYLDLKTLGLWFADLAVVDENSKLSYNQYLFIKSRPKYGTH